VVRIKLNNGQGKLGGYRVNS